MAERSTTNLLIEKKSTSLSEHSIMMKKVKGEREVKIVLVSLITTLQGLLVSNST